MTRARDESFDASQLKVLSALGMLSEKSAADINSKTARNHVMSPILGHFGVWCWVQALPFFAAPTNAVPRNVHPKPKRIRRAHPEVMLGQATT